MNMHKEYKSELRMLTKASKKITRDWKATKTARIRRLRQLQSEHDRAVHQINTQYSRGTNACYRELTRIDKRRAILQARLDS